MSGHEVLEESHNITTAGKTQLEDDARGVIAGATIHKSGVKCPAKVSIGVVPSLGRDLFFVPQATLQRAIMIFAVSLIGPGSFVLLLKQGRNPGLLSTRASTWN